MLKKLAAVTLAAAVLAGCAKSGGGTPATPTAAPSISLPSASPTPEGRAVSLKLVKHEVKLALNEAAEVYATTPVGEAEGRKIEAIATTLEKRTGCEQALIPAFISAMAASSFLHQGDAMGIDITGAAGKQVMVQNKSVLRKLEELIESEYDVKVTVRSAKITVLVIVIGCNVTTTPAS